MELSYRINLNDREISGVVSVPFVQDGGNGGLRCSTAAEPVGDGFSLLIHLEEEEALSARKCWAELKNDSGETVRLREISMGMRLPVCHGTLHYFSSSWGKEFVPHELLIPERFGIGALHGKSSEEYSPWIGMACEHGFFSLAIGWPGNWSCALDNRNGACSFVMGIQPQGFFTDVASSEAFTGAPLYIVSSATSLDEASLRTGKFFLKHYSALRPEKIETLPVVFNTWWCYEDRFINEDVCVNAAGHAAELGMTNFMLDAGWFGVPQEKINWKGKRGDWHIENTVDFPSGLSHLGEAVESAGIPFGIWCEIEAVGPIASLHQTHPGMIARRDGESLGYLCMGNPETRQWAMRVIDRLVNEYHARWIKLDFNVSPGFGCNDPSHGHGEGDGLYWHYRGYETLLKEVRKKYPEVVLENCSGGGMRNDLGILTLTDYAYMSDHDYADNHFQCLWGATSFLHPALCYQFMQSECISDHNGIFNPITEDITPAKLDYYIRAALLSTCGFSYRFQNWKPEWKERLKEYIAFFKHISKDYILDGDMYRLTGQALRGGKGDRWQAYQYRAQYGWNYVFLFRLPGAEDERVLRFQALEPDTEYDILFHDREHRITRTGRSFMEDGLLLSGLPEEGSEILLLRPGF